MIIIIFDLNVLIFIKVFFREVSGGFFLLNDLIWRIYLDFVCWFLDLIFFVKSNKIG